MEAAVRPNDVLVDLFFGTVAVLIPKDHPAYTDPPKALPSRVEQRWSTLVATVVGLMSVAAISSSVAHYTLEAGAPAGEAASVSPAVTAAIPAAQPTTPAAEPTATSQARPLSAAPTAEATSAPAVEAAPSVANAPSVAAKRLTRSAARPPKFASLAREKADRSEAQRREVAAFDASPLAADAVPGSPLDPFTSMLRVDNTNRR